MLRNILTTTIITNFKNSIHHRPLSALTLEYNTPPPNFTMLNIMEDKFQYLGLIKNMPHFLNNKNEVYCRFDDEIEYEHVADWNDEYKMLWTENPIIYKLHIHKNIKYFYDVEFCDAYTYCYKKHIVIPIGTWNKMEKKINFYKN